mmetsp:Transcript_9463/g.17847  ORF Transcript_9463/g.17847 Transcript_9463/m.17847 type:complete len:168 (-) Transcript_9463:259-762(-)
MGRKSRIGLETSSPEILHVLLLVELSPEEEPAEARDLNILPPTRWLSESSCFFVSTPSAIDSDVFRAPSLENMPITELRLNDAFMFNHQTCCHSTLSNHRPTTQRQGFVRQTSQSWTQNFGTHDNLTVTKPLPEMQFKLVELHRNSSRLGQSPELVPQHGPTLGTIS